MSFKLGKTSMQRLRTCKEPIQEIVQEAIKRTSFDFGVVCGVRTKEEQQEAFDNGNSKVQWPNSKHNVLNPGDLSSAVDLAPYGYIPELKRTGYDWNAPHSMWRTLAELILEIAEEKGYRIRWGGDWNMDGRTRHDGDKNEKFVDYPHFELLEG